MVRDDGLWAAGREAAQVALEAIRANARPALFLQGVLAVFLALYFFHGETREWMEWLAERKREIGYPFAVVSYIVAAAILPEIVRVVTFQRGRVRAENFRMMLGVAPLWGAMGATVDALYRLQVTVFGDSNAPGVIAAKVAVDQFLFSPFISAPVIAFWVGWVASGFSARAVRDAFTRDFVLYRVLPLVVAGWCVWIPAVSVVYWMPAALQLPTAVVVQVFWVLVLTAVATRPQRISA